MPTLQFPDNVTKSHLEKKSNPHQAVITHRDWCYTAAVFRYHRHGPRFLRFRKRLGGVITPPTIYVYIVCTVVRTVLVVRKSAISYAINRDDSSDEECRIVWLRRSRDFIVRSCCRPSHYNCYYLFQVRRVVVFVAHTYVDSKAYAEWGIFSFIYLPAKRVYLWLAK